MDAAKRAQHKLTKRLEEHHDEIMKRYSRPHAPLPDEYWIHNAKFLPDLLEYLTKHNLAWQSYDPVAKIGLGRTWYALHPTLGSAIMTTIGLSIAHASQQQYEIVTPSVQYHEKLLTTDEHGILDAILREQNDNQRTVAQVEHDFAQVVITMAANLRALPPEMIPDLQRSKHFEAFQRQVRKVAHTIPAGGAAKDYMKALTLEAEDLIEAWQQAKTGLTKEITDALWGVGDASRY